MTLGVNYSSADYNTSTQVPHRLNHNLKAFFWVIWMICVMLRSPPRDSTPTPHQLRQSPPTSKRLRQSRTCLFSVPLLLRSALSCVDSCTFGPSARSAVLHSPSTLVPPCHVTRQ